MVVQVTTKVTVRDDDNRIIKSEMHSYMCNPETESIHSVSLGAMKGYEMVRDMVDEVRGNLRYDERTMRISERADI